MLAEAPYQLFAAFAAGSSWHFAEYKGREKQPAIALGLFLIAGSSISSRVF